MLFEGEFEKEEFTYTGAIVPPPLPTNGPNQKLPKEILLEVFYRSLSTLNKAVVDGIAKCSMITHTFAEASQILDKMTKTNNAWYTQEFEAASMSHSRGMIAE
ncbi:hypothetical protein HAX54_027419 [Datura stramonium]|uniref:Uncharacterized protein n=1 Tax=Datura stramonium TaxID=4076 RepID=A0ABS8V5L1_DATST|nr:hypothetical protein [Datura stramonium]